MSFRIKNCIPARSDNTSVAGLVKSHNYKFKIDPVKDEIKTEDDKDVKSRITTLENSSTKPCMIHQYISDRIRALEDKVLDNSSPVTPLPPTSNLQPVIERVTRIESVLTPIQSSITSIEKSHNDIIKRTSELEKTSSLPLASEPVKNVTVTVPKTVMDRIVALERSHSSLPPSSSSPSPSLFNDNLTSLVDTLSTRIENIEKIKPPSYEISVLDRISSLESKQFSPKSPSVVEIPKSVLDRISVIENRPLVDNSLSDRIVSLEKSLNLSKVNDRITAMETKINKSDISKILTDRISVLENKKIKMDVPKSILDRLSTVETKIGEIESGKASPQPEPSQELLGLIKTLTDRISSLETESSKLKNKISSLSEDEDFTSLQSPSSTNSNSLVRIK